MWRMLLLTLIILTLPASVPHVHAQDSELLFEGVIYTRIEQIDPVPAIAHIIRVELTAPGIDFAVTPGDPNEEFQLASQTTSDFLAESDVQIAINANYFAKPEGGGLLSGFYFAGTPVQALGLAASDGITYSPNNPTLAPLTITADNQIGINAILPGYAEAIAGRYVILQDGAARRIRGENGRDARTAIGLSEDGQTLFLAVVDGRQSGISEGMTYIELAELLREFGAWDAINLDGGGSSTLVIAGPDGPVTLNRPVGNQIAGFERPVANHLGIFAQTID